MATKAKDGKAASEETAAPVEGAAPTEGTGPTRVVWKDDNMSSSFANVVNVFSTREEMTLLFGTNETWNAMNSEELVVNLSDRIMLTPFAAKRLSILLDRRVKEYEDRFGKLDL